MIFRTEDDLMLMLAADINQRFADDGQIGHCRHLPVDQRFILAGAGNYPANYEFISCGKSQRRNFFFQRFISGNIKESFHRRRISLRSDHAHGGPVTQKQAYRADDNRFSGAGLAGNNIEPSIE